MFRANQQARPALFRSPPPPAVERVPNGASRYAHTTKGATAPPVAQLVERADDAKSATVRAPGTAKTGVLEYLTPPAKAYAPTAPTSLAKKNMVCTTAWFAINVATTVGAACLVGTLVPSVGSVAAIVAGIAAVAFEIAALSARSPKTQMASSAAFSTLMGVGMARFAQQVGLAVMGTAAVYTGALAGALVLTALVCPPESFRGWGGPLSGALVGLLFCRVATALMPASWGIVGALSVGQSVLGLGLFSAFTAFDVAMVAEQADKEDFNPVHRGMGIYLDVLNMFMRIVELMVHEKARKK